MITFRFVHKLYAGKLTGSGVDGRWNSGGRKVLYCAESIPLAFAESVFRRKGLGFSTDFYVDIIEIPDNLKIDKVDVSKLPADWRSPLEYPSCQAFGNQWYDGLGSIALEVPSALFAFSYQTTNYVLNLSHSDMNKVRIVKSELFIPDPRFESLLRNMV